MICLKNTSLISHFIKLFKAPEPTVSFLGDGHHKPQWNIIDNYDKTVQPPLSLALKGRLSFFII